MTLSTPAAFVAALLSVVFFVACAHAAGSRCYPSWSTPPDFQPNDEEQSRFGCTFTRNVKCDKPPERKAAVFYMITNNDEEYTSLVEWDSFAFFLQNGLLAQNESTAMFKQVDFIFTRLRKDISQVTMCAQKGNIRMLWVPPGPCDLCAHTRVMDFIDISEYQHFIFMNSGVRGPFVHRDSSSWIDVVASSGHTRLYNDAKHHPHPPILAASAVSWMHGMHPQSYFLSAPRAAIDRVLRTLWKGSCVNDKAYCTIEGEVRAGMALVEAGVAVHSLGRNFTIYNADDNAKMLDKHRLPPPDNPCLYFQEPCYAIFIKFGGDVYRKQLLHRPTMKLVSRLTSYTKTRPSTARALFSSILKTAEKCEYLS